MWVVGMCMEGLSDLTTRSAAFTTTVRQFDFICFWSRSRTWTILTLNSDLKRNSDISFILMRPVMHSTKCKDQGVIIYNQR